MRGIAEKLARAHNDTIDHNSNITSTTINLTVMAHFAYFIGQLGAEAPNYEHNGTSQKVNLRSKAN
jgi:hypothetical protein